MALASRTKAVTGRRSSSSLLVIPMHGVAKLTQTFGRATQAVDEFGGDRPQNEDLAIALDGQLGADREFHLLADLGGDDDLALGAQGCVFGLHSGYGRGL